MTDRTDHEPAVATAIGAVVDVEALERAIRDAVATEQPTLDAFAPLAARAALAYLGRTPDAIAPGPILAAIAARGWVASVAGPFPDLPDIAWQAFVFAGHAASGRLQVALGQSLGPGLGTALLRAYCAALDAGSLVGGEDAAAPTGGDNDAG